MAEITQAIIGIDPGVSAGAISVLDNGILKSFKMPESFKEIREILRPYSSHPTDDTCRCSIEMLASRPMQDAFITKRMEPMIRNFDRIKDALDDCNIGYKPVAPRTWQKFHRLELPKGKYEKGYDHELYSSKKENVSQLDKHLTIERISKSDVVLSQHIIKALEVSGSQAARKMLGDNYSHFTKHQLRAAKNELEKEMKKLKGKEKQIRKKRYQKKAQAYIGDSFKVPQWQADAILILLYQKYNSDKV